MDKFSIKMLFLSFFGSGYAPKAPGTVGTLASIPVGLLIIYYLGLESLFMLTFAITIIGIVEVNKYENEHHTHDESWIVIDETAGIWLTMIISLYGLLHYNIPYGEVIAIVGSFILFRLFDIYKPSTIGWIDRNLKGGLGVMLDDILAGFAAGLLNLLIMKVIYLIL